MEDATLAQILRNSAAYFWDRLIFLKSATWRTQTFYKWRLLLKASETDIDDLICQSSDNDLCILLHEWINEDDISYFNIKELIYAGRLDLLCKMLSIRDYDLICKVFNATAHYGSIETLRWLIKMFSLTQNDVISPAIFAFIVRSNRLDVLKWLTKEFHLRKYDVLDDSIWALKFAAREGYFEILQWITDEFDLKKEDLIKQDNYVYEAAKACKHSDILEWLERHFGIAE